MLVIYEKELVTYKKEHFFTLPSSSSGLDDSSLEQSLGLGQRLAKIAKVPIPAVKDVQRVAVRTLLYRSVVSRFSYVWPVVS